MAGLPLVRMLDTGFVDVLREVEEPEQTLAVLIEREEVAAKKHSA